MKVEVLGAGCAKCKELEARVKRAAGKCAPGMEIVKVDDIGEIVARGVLSTPALVVDGKVVCYGRVPREDEIAGWLADPGKR